jgi:hypothetical protein
MRKYREDKLKNRVIKKSIFRPYPPKDLKLDDFGLVYFDGIKWKIIEINHLLQYPVIL